MTENFVGVLFESVKNVPAFYSGFSLPFVSIWKYIK